MFGWFKSRRRRKLLSAEPTAKERYWTEETLWQYHHLPSSLQRQLLDTTRVLVAEKNWEGCKGLILTDQIRFAIAAQSAMLLLGFPGEYFDWVGTVLVYPDAYLVEDNLFATGSNLAVVGSQAREGQTIRGGPVIVNWSAIADQVLDRTGSGERGSPWTRTDFHHNLVVHEFSHQLDMVGDGIADGIPPLSSHVNARSWEQAFRQAFEHRRQVANRQYGFRIDSYGLTSLVEYFAVCSESYFQTPHEFADAYSETFDLLRDFYQIDWRAYLPRLS
jgi:Mlc titration factor MtfA (ptsG expression regulator)